MAQGVSRFLVVLGHSQVFVGWRLSDSGWVGLTWFQLPWFWVDDQLDDFKLKAADGWFVRENPTGRLGWLFFGSV